MESTQLKEYVSKAKELELSCYQQELLIARIKATVNKLRKEQQSLAGTTKESVRSDSLLGTALIAISTAFYFAFMAALAGLLIGLVIGIIVAFVQFYTGLPDHNIIVVLFEAIVGILFHNDGWRVTGRWIIHGVFFGAIGGFSVGFILGLLGHTSKKAAQKMNRIIDISNQSVYSEIALCDRKIHLLLRNLDLAENTYKESLVARDKFYAANVIYKNYRNLIPVAMFDGYLQSGRCSALEGHEGAYNLYESEKRMELILTKLDDIIARLDEISENQLILANELRSSQQQVDYMSQRIAQSLQSLEETAEVSQYYSQITARNTSFLAWLSYFS